MKEYPSTSKQFKVNGKEFTMRQYTLGLQSRIEDENAHVTIMDVIAECTTMKNDEILNLDNTQALEIYKDIQEFTYTTETEDPGDKKKA